MGWRERKGSGLSVSTLWFRTRALSPGQPPKVFANKRLFLLIYPRSSSCTVNMDGREGLGFNQSSIQFTIDSLAHSTVYLTKMWRVSTLFWAIQDAGNTEMTSSHWYQECATRRQSDGCHLYHWAQPSLSWHSAMSPPPLCKPSMRAWWTPSLHMLPLPEKRSQRD